MVKIQKSFGEVNALNWEKRSLAIGVVFIALALYSLFQIIFVEYTSYYLTASIVGTIIGIGFLKKAHNS